VSRSPDPREASGFTLVEVIVAVGVFLVVMTAILPQLVVALKATSTARLVSQAKGVAQGQLDLMRNMPFHVAPTAGDHIDVLDTYFRSLAVLASTPTCMSGAAFLEPQTAWSGYVPAGATRCSYEPAGALYRKVINPVTGPGLGQLALVVDTQFLSAATPPAVIAPPSGYDSQVTNQATPASHQIAVTVTVVYQTRGIRRPVTTYTQISRRDPAAARIRAEATVTAVEIGSSTPADGALSLSAGLLNLSGALFHTSGVTANLAATSAGVSSGVQGSGAASTIVAPPALTAALTSAGEGALSVGGCQYACWGTTRVGPLTVTAEDGLPRAGTPSAPLQVLVPAGTTRGGFMFGNGSTDGGLNLVPPLVTLDTTLPPLASGLVNCQPSGSGDPSFLTASGYLLTTDDNDVIRPETVETCGAARTTTISLFPTTFAPKGVVLIELTSAAARCTVSGASHAPATYYGYGAVVQYWGGSAYVPAAVVTPGMITDPLALLPLTTSVGNGHTLGDYIASWSSLTADKVTVTSSPGVAAVSLPGVITVASQPVRAAEATSTVSVAVGAVGCRAEDSR